jgi:hypothetical protein
MLKHAAPVMLISSADTARRIHDKLGIAGQARAMTMRWRCPPLNSCAVAGACSLGKPDRGKQRQRILALCAPCGGRAQAVHVDGLGTLSPRSCAG